MTQASLYDITGDIKDINTMLVPKQLLERAEKDAARYRWLKTGNDEKHSRAMQIAVNSYGYEWDELIDAAMKEQK